MKKGGREAARCGKCIPRRNFWLNAHREAALNAPSPPPSPYFAIYYTSSRLNVDFHSLSNGRGCNFLDSLKLAAIKLFLRKQKPSKKVSRCREAASATELAGIFSFSRFVAPLIHPSSANDFRPSKRCYTYRLCARYGIGDSRIVSSVQALSFVYWTGSFEAARAYEF